MILNILILIFFGTLLANFIAETIIDCYIYVKKKLREDKKNEQDSTGPGNL
ncbi:hypothetical protein HIF96_08540 [Helcococcus kunzii]|uniref:hypothetical protein n=1 Tax=Helcococcus kunzii TaxID=40091 RepID=UPI001C9401F1|nr:hypothetical protein [Helcococcus kunzii]QZO76322.1 hypothetical protein HIF96_08540 [Helcococcus kunzii]